MAIATTSLEAEVASQGLREAIESLLKCDEESLCVVLEASLGDSVVEAILVRVMQEVVEVKR